MSDRRNILLVTADQWRGDCLGALGHPVIETPQLDALARRGVLFSQHFANAVPCGPSRASLHTGLYLHNHRSGTNGTPLDRRFSNWALELRAAGFDPAVFGYTHTAPDPRGLPADDPSLITDQGVLPGIVPIIDMGTHCPDWRRWLIERGYELPPTDGATYAARETVAEGLDVPRASLWDRKHTDTWFLTDQVIDYIDQQSTDPGWAVHLSLRAPHPPWIAAAPYHRRYQIDSLPPPERRPTAAEEGALHPWLAQHLASDRNQSHEDDRRHRLLQASYYGLMAEVDDNMGRLLDHLDASGELDSTLVMFTSDHGEQMGDHWLYGKTGFFDQSFRVPMIVAGPGVKPGLVDRFTEHVDIMPTLLDWLGLPCPRQCDGHSLGPFLDGAEPATWRQAAHFEYDFRHSQAEADLGLSMETACLNVIRDHEYKYVHFAELPPLLFDLCADPHELTDISVAQPAVVAEYARRLLSWRLEYTDKTLSHITVTKDAGVTTRA
ncbi:MAG: alkaline phosphatase family protein [Pseudomonadales bacterium]